MWANEYDRLAETMDKRYLAKFAGRDPLKVMDAVGMRGVLGARLRRLLVFWRCIAEFHLAPTLALRMRKLSFLLVEAESVNVANKTFVRVVIAVLGTSSPLICSTIECCTFNLLMSTEWLGNRDIAIA